MGKHCSVWPPRLNMTEFIFSPVIPKHPLQMGRNVWNGAGKYKWRKDELEAAMKEMGYINTGYTATNEKIWTWKGKNRVQEKAEMLIWIG